MTGVRIQIPEARGAQVCSRHGIRTLSLFGSVLTDRFSGSSDIDMLV
jgi:predicted nucleotidyltransferase